MASVVVGPADVVSSASGEGRLKLDSGMLSVAESGELASIGLLMLLLLVLLLTA